MPYDIIPFFIITACFLIIIFMLARKFPALKVLDINTITEEREKKIKKTILESRLKRNLDRLLRMVTLFLRPFFEKILTVVRHFYHRILALERKYKDEAATRRNSQIEPEEKIHQYLHEANEKMKTSETPMAAEELFIKVIEIDNKNIDAYKGLNELYMKAHDYQKAKEVGRYILRLSLDGYKKDASMEKKQTVASCYAHLGEIEQNLENMPSAMKNYKEALKLHPNNPKFLDLLLRISIIVKDKKLARTTLQELKLADPENQKIIDLEKEVEGL